MAWTSKVACAALLLACSCSSSVHAPDLHADAHAEVGPDARAPQPDLSRQDLRADAPCKLVKPYSTKNAPCNQCAESTCCVELNGCLASPDCDDFYVNCTLACALGRAPDAGLSACLGACAKDYPKGKAEYDVAIGCADSRCATECK